MSTIARFRWFWPQILGYKFGAGCTPLVALPLTQSPSCHAALVKMQYSNLFLIRGTIWTIAAFVVGVLFRMITSVALARLLAPEFFGIMTIVNSIRQGVDLVSDVGIGQNIVHNPNAEDPLFYNTAWTLRLIRSVLLWLLCLVAAAPVAYFYEVPILLTVLPVTGLFFVITALGSVAPFLLRKRIQYVRQNVFNVAQAAFSAVAYILLAYLIPSLWALVFGSLVATAGQSIGSYFLLPNVHHKLQISREFARQIFSYGRWVFISSIVFFLSMNFDRLYFGKVAVLSVVGVYGIARSLSELVGTLFFSLSENIIFPLIAASQTTPRDQLRSALSIKRLSVLLFGGASIAAATAIGDLVIRLLYDQRYQAAGWMLPLLLIGEWFALIAGINEWTLLGFGRPVYSAATNTCRFLWLLIGFPIGFTHFGALGVVVVVASSNICRYIPTLVGLVREKFSFAGQDIFATLFTAGVLGLLELIRWSFGFGTSFDGLSAVILR